MGFDARGREWPLAEMISVLQKEGQYLWSSRGLARVGRMTCYAREARDVSAVVSAAPAVPIHLGTLTGFTAEAISRRVG
jgi:hypothetical protein